MSFLLLEKSTTGGAGMARGNRHFLPKYVELANLYFENISYIYLAFRARKMSVETHDRSNLYAMANIQRMTTENPN